MLAEACYDPVLEPAPLPACQSAFLRHGRVQTDKVQTGKVQTGRVQTNRAQKDRVQTQQAQTVRVPTDSPVWLPANVLAQTSNSLSLKKSASTIDTIKKSASGLHHKNPTI